MSLLNDESMEVVIPAVEVILHALPGYNRNQAISRIMDISDDDLKATAMVRIMEGNLTELR